VGCTPSPLTSEVFALAHTATSKREVSFGVRVQNESGETQIFPTRYEVFHTTSVNFIRDAPSGKLVSKIMDYDNMLSGDYANSSNSVSICPPQFDYLPAGGI
jgi:hypothetical protein